MSGKRQVEDEFYSFEKCNHQDKKLVHENYIPLNPTFIQQNWGMQGYTYFSYFCSIWGGISSDIRSEILFNNDVSAEL